MTAENWGGVAHLMGTSLFIMVLAAIWFGCSNAARDIVGEWTVYHRERMVNLKIPSYVASKFGVLGTLCVVQCAILLGVVHRACGFKGPWLPMFGMLLLASWVGVALGLTISAAARTTEMAVSLLPLTLIPMVVLGGMMLPPHEMSAPMRVAADGIPARWAFEGVLLLESDWQPRFPPLTPPRLGAMAEAKDTSPVGRASESVDHTQTGGLQPKDIAERSFPLEQRGAVERCVASLIVMLVIFLAVVGVILRLRDVH